MRIEGCDTAKRYSLSVRLPRVDGAGPVLLLSPLPLGFQRRLREHQVTPPTPPSRVARDPQGRPLRQANGAAVLLSDEHDADYLAERELYHQRVAVLSVVESLRADPQVTFDTHSEDYPHDCRPYADRLYAELEAAEWTAGDLVWLCAQVCPLSNLIDAHLAEAGADFFSAAATTGRS